MKLPYSIFAPIIFLFAFFLALATIDWIRGESVDWWGHLITSVITTGGILLLKKLEAIHNKRNS